jgi:hypothetical protein
MSALGVSPMDSTHLTFPVRGPFRHSQKDVRADIRVDNDIDLWELLQENAKLTLHLNDGRQ